MGGSLEFCNTSGGSEKFYPYSRASLKIYKTWKISWSPLPVKNDTSLKALGFFLPVEHCGGGVFPPLSVKLDPDILESWNLQGW